MEKGQLVEMHKEYWEKVKKVIPHSLELPYLEINSVRQAYNNLHESLTGRKEDIGVSDVDIPAAMRKIEPLGNRKNLFFGGILIPESCLSDDDEVTRYGLVHEQVHDVLRNSAIIYGLNGIFDASYPEIAQIFDGFTEYTAHGLAFKALREESVSLEDCVKGTVEVYDKRARLFSGSLNPDACSDEHIMAVAAGYQKYMDDIAGLDPISEFDRCFNIFTKGYFTQQKIELCWSGLAYLAGANLSVKRRVSDGSWESVSPLILPKPR